MRIKDITINYIANAGVLICKGNTKLLLDGIHSQKVPIFSTVSQEVLSKMISGEGIFKDISYLLFTHGHQDHFSPDCLVKYISHNKIKAIFLPEEAYCSLSKSGKDIVHHNGNLITMKAPYGKKEEVTFNNVKIKYFKITHDGANYQDVANYGFIIDFAGTILLHLGDGGFEREILEESLLGEKIDYAFLNFPYVNLTQGRKIINEIIKPKKVFVIHLPNEADDLYKYREVTLKVLEKYKKVLPETIALVDP